MIVGRWLTRNAQSRGDSYAINLCPELRIPYGAMDVRDEPISATKKYGDLYKRTLPFSLHARRILRDTARTLRKKKKPLFAVFVTLCVLSLPSLFYARILVESAYGRIGEMKNATNFSELSRSMRLSREEFERANLLFFPYRWLPWDQIKLAKVAIDGGLALTRGGDALLSHMWESTSGTVMKPIRTVGSLFRPDAVNITPLINLGIEKPTNWIQTHEMDIRYLREELSTSGKAYKNALTLDHEKSAEIAHIGRGIEQFVGVIDFYLAHSKDVLAMLGADTPQRYIVLNQNRDELRANGWFPGTVVSFTMNHGNFEDFRTDDVYYYDWNLYPYKELPPPWLALITGNYGLRDVNYYPDFRETLEKANSFIERSGDPTVTIGIALHQGLIEDILKDIGPLTLSGVSEPFTSDNFSLLMSTLVEARYGERTSAKDVLGDFVHTFIKKINKKRAYEEVLTHIYESLQNGEILFASRNPTIENFLETYKKPLPWQQKWTWTTPDGQQSENLLWKMTSLFENLSGKNTSQSSAVRYVSHNWVYPLITSLSGNKSDRLISRDYRAETARIWNCIFENRLTFTHQHHWNTENEKNTIQYLDMIGITDRALREKLLTIQWKWPNKAYIRVLAPLHAILTGSTSGIENGATPEYREFSFTLETPIGAISTKTLRYQIEFPWCAEEKEIVSWYRQPWLQKVQFESR